MLSTTTRRLPSRIGLIAAIAAAALAAVGGLSLLRDRTATTDPAALDDDGFPNASPASEPAVTLLDEPMQPQPTFVDVGPPGAVTVRRNGDLVEIARVLPADGWEVERWDIDPARTVEAVFVRDREQMAVKVTTDGDELVTTVDEPSEHPDGFTECVGAPTTMEDRPCVPGTP